jgi:hypothetical protein
MTKYNRNSVISPLKFRLIDTKFDWKLTKSHKICVVATCLDELLLLYKNLRALRTYLGNIFELFRRFEVGLTPQNHSGTLTPLWFLGVICYISIPASNLEQIRSQSDI